MKVIVAESAITEISKRWIMHVVLIKHQIQSQLKSQKYGNPYKVNYHPNSLALKGTKDFKYGSLRKG